MTFGLPDLAAWISQLIALAVGWHLARSSRPMEGREPAWTVCLLVIVSAWSVRLAYQFVLASSGFWYFVADDPCRWLLACGWAQKPYLVTWDGVWQGGTFYLHGLAMRLSSDQLVASKFVSLSYSLSCLVGFFLLSYGISRDRALACLTVVLAAPMWLHILLSTGAMAELPTMAALFSGGGLLLLGVTSEGRRRKTLLLGAAFALAVGTAFHVAAWVVTGVVVALLLYKVIWPDRKERWLSLGEWATISAVSISYCVLWFAGCWWKFGRPFQFLENYVRQNNLASGQRSLLERVVAYPRSVVFNEWEILPLVVAGIVVVLFGKGRQAKFGRGVLVTATLALGALILSTVRGNVAGEPYRATICIAAVMIPLAAIALKPPLTAVVAGMRGAGTGTRKTATGALVLGAVLVCWGAANHRLILARERFGNQLDADAIALGVWLRQEFIRPQSLDSAGLQQPVVIWTAARPLYPELAILHEAGQMSRVEWWRGEAEPTESAMKIGQYLVTDRPLKSKNFRPILTFGRFFAFRFGA